MFKLTGAYWCLNEAEYYPEYLEFHLLQGFDHFIFYLNAKNSDNTVEILTPYIKAGLVELRFYPPNVTQRNNFWMMDHLIKEQVGITEWIHFHALDERLISKVPGKSIPDLLRDYWQFGGLSVAWEEFNSSGKLTKEPGLIIERFTTTAKDTASHIKTIIRPETVINHCGNPHNFMFKNGFGAVDEKFNSVRDAWNPKNYSFDKIKNNHFNCMSLEEYDRKANKGLLDHAGQENIRRLAANQIWDWLHNKAEQGTNTELLQYVEPVKAALRKRYEPYPELYKIIQAWYNL